MAFGSASTAQEVLAGIDLAGKRILITGVSAGLGAETARALVSRGAHVVGTVRDVAAGGPALEVVRAAAAAGQGGLDLVPLDLAALSTVRACADLLLTDGRPFDVVIANAGVMACPEGRTQDGFETQFGTNHIGHFVLINRIAPLMGAGARLIVLSSASHRAADVDLDDPHFDAAPYDPLVAYARSKTANILFAVAFDRRHRDRGVRATAVHPGSVDTDLNRHMGEARNGELVGLLNDRLAAAGQAPLIYKSVEQGAATSVWAAAVAAPEAIGGRYCQDCAVATVTPPDIIRDGVRSYAMDPDRADALWARSEAMAGERF